MQRDEDSIYDIVLACRDIAQFIGILTAEQFAAEKLIRSAVLHQLTVIGEATKRLS